MRVVNRFQRVVGFDRSMALASSALTALIPLALLAGALFGHFGHWDLADRVINRYGLTGGGAEAVRQLFSPVADAGTSVGILGAVFLVISVLSFTRAAQRLFEQTWELKPLSVKNTPNGVRWVLGLGAYLVATGWVRSLLGRGRLELLATLCTAPLTAVLLVGSGWMLSAKRIPWRDLVPFAVIGAVLLGVYSVGAVVYLPHLFSSYATRYGSVGAVFAMISALFSIMLVVVGSAALGREVREELVRIAHGRRPPDDEVRREWDHLVAQMRSRWRSARDRRADQPGPGSS
ncbi:YhjD/YihY/BrkB family envelope integrity protein [Kitasatospora sp. NPDC058965]|uniref:YhjD/YihY/BrkB family envelope integrity protein n=1 Tax=Kitasatospora sp. NPDC058965 TaxID=3346682 RepID=UPI00367B8B72